MIRVENDLKTFSATKLLENHLFITTLTPYTINTVTVTLLMSERMPILINQVMLFAGVLFPVDLNAKVLGDLKTRFPTPQFKTAKRSKL